MPCGVAEGMKPETEIRNLKRELRTTGEDYRVLRVERDAYRSRATKAEQDAAEWKKRFDELLSKCRGFDPVTGGNS